MRVKDKVVVIRGASSGIGRAAARAFADAGAAVVLAARREDALKHAVRECEERGAQALAVATDVSDAKAVRALARAAVDTPIFQHAANYTGRSAMAMPPVYSPERVARAIVNLVRAPRREIVVGPMGRNLVTQFKLTPDMVERLLAFQVDRTHLSRNQPAPATSGNLYSPAPGPGAVDGGWDGRRKTAVRRLAVGGFVLSAAAAGARRLLR